MKNSGGFSQLWNNLKEKKQTEEAQSVEVLPDEEEKHGNKVTEVFSVIGRVIYRLRKVFMAIPVIYYAVKLAQYNAENLPELVGLNLQTTGEFAQMISREAAVQGPLLVTGACLVLMLFSRRAVYPWLISIFSLVLPLLLLLTNIYPA